MAKKEKKNKEYWSMTEGVFNCLIDNKRTISFTNAIKKTVKKGDVVVDMGTGTGILAMFAADVGARKVYAIEIDKKNIKTLKESFLQNGYDRIIEIIEGDVREVKIPEKIDVIIGEMIATGLIEELQIPAMNNILKYAKKDCRVLLNKYENYIDLVNNNDIYYGKKFFITRYEYPDEKELKSKSFSSKYLLNIVDFNIINISNVIDKKIEIEINKKGIINGVRISSKTIFYDKTFFDYSFAYSYPIILPIDTMHVGVGDIFVLHIKYNMCEGFKTLKYSINKK